MRVIWGDNGDTARGKSRRLGQTDSLPAPPPLTAESPRPTIRVQATASPPSMGTSMKKLNLLMLAASVILISYYMWNFFVGSRYQALCNVDYWHATPAQIDACKEVKSEFDDRK
jgi:hypothetical protein